MNAMNPCPTIPEALRNPRAISLKRLVSLTKHFYAMSAASSAASNFHQWYYCMACECERRGYDLTRIIHGRKAAKV